MTFGREMFKIAYPTVPCSQHCSLQMGEVKRRESSRDWVVPANRHFGRLGGEGVLVCPKEVDRLLVGQAESSGPLQQGYPSSNRREMFFTMAAKLCLMGLAFYVSDGLRSNESVTMRVPQVIYLSTGRMRRHDTGRLVGIWAGDSGEGDGVVSLVDDDLRGNRGLVTQDPPSAALRHRFGSPCCSY